MWQILLTVVMAVCRQLPIFYRRTLQAVTRILVATDTNVPVIPEGSVIELLAAGWCPRRFMVVDPGQSDPDDPKGDVGRANTCRARFSLLLVYGIPDISLLRAGNSK